MLSALCTMHQAPDDIQNHWTPSAATAAIARRHHEPPPPVRRRAAPYHLKNHEVFGYSINLVFIEQVIDSTLSDWCIVVLQRDLPHHHYSIEKIPQDNCFLIVHQPRGPIRACGIFVRPWVVSDSDLCVATHGPI